MCVFIAAFLIAVQHILKPVAKIYVFKHKSFIKYISVSLCGSS